ncbi:TPA: hypothetical protein JG813_004623 [Vibrio parahaemolyticus]|nr:hypothetical protein [Vibrio parahaemolyticus]
MEREILDTAKRYNSLVSDLRTIILNVVEGYFENLVDELPRYYPKSLHLSCRRGFASLRKDQIRQMVEKHKANLNREFNAIELDSLNEGRLSPLTSYPIVYTQKNVVEKAIPPKFQPVIRRCVKLLVDEIVCLSWLNKSDDPKLNYLDFYEEISMTQEVIDILSDIKALENEHREKILELVAHKEEQNMKETMAIWIDA